MHVANEGGVFEQQLRRPQGIAQVGPAPLQLGGERAVEEDYLIVMK
jgi:hypothetical protein